jgi:hypothetical protein
MSLKDHLDRQVPAYCPKGHAIRIWGGPLYVNPGEVPNMWGNPIICGECDLPLGVQRGY